jgi:ketosteroid isomerase-like protein
MRPIVFVTMAILAAPPGTAAQQMPVEERAVMQTIDRANLAYQHRDLKTYDGLVTADFVRVIPNGRAFGRSEWLKSVGAPGAERTAAKFDQPSVRVYGNAAVVTYHSMENTTTGEPAAGTYLTRVMVKEGSQWKTAFAQSTDAQPPAAPTSAEPPALPAWSATTAAEREVLAAFQAIQKANRESDLTSWEKLAAPDHRIINNDGTTMTRAERVAQIKATAPGTTAPVAEQELRVAIKGDLAILSWKDAEERSLKVLVRKNGVWQQVLHQSTPVVAAK